MAHSLRRGHRSTWAWASVLVLMSACQPADDVERTTADAARPDEDSHVGNCTQDEQGCACEPGSGPIDCYLPPEYRGDELVCHAGKRYCRDGRWTECGSIHSYTLDRNWADDLSKLVSQPTQCNVCNPDCSLVTDYPTGTDITAGNSTQVEYVAGNGGISLVPEGFGVVTTDTDGDGVPDAADTHPNDPTITGVERGLYHLMPYNGAFFTDPLSFNTDITTADIYVLMDTSSSMQGEIDNLQAALRTGTYNSTCAEGINGGILGAIRCEIPNAWFGVGQFREVPLSPHGDANELVYHHVLDITSSLVAAQDAVDTLVVDANSDWPESQTQALYSIASGNGLGKFVPNRATCSGTNWGYPCFRQGTIPIVLMFTDAPFNNGPAGFAYNAAATSASVRLPRARPVSGNDANGTAYNMGDARTQWLSFLGSTTNMTNGHNSTCSANAADSVFKFTLTATTSVTMSTEGSDFNTVLSLWNSAGTTRTSCNDDDAASYYTRTSKLTASLAAGTYTVVVDGNSTSTGSYRLMLGNNTVTATAPFTTAFPVSWATSRTALQNANLRIISVVSCADGDFISQAYCPYTISDANSLGTATSSTNGAGTPFVYSISSTGSGLSTTVVGGVQSLANSSRLDITARAVDNPATVIDERNFVKSVSPTTCPSARCSPGATGSACNGCTPGTGVGFTVTFRNDFVPHSTVAQIFTFTMEVVGDGSFVLDSVPVKIMVPPTITTYPAQGSYRRDYDSTVRCEVPPQRPDWGSFTWTTTTPVGTNVQFQLRTAETSAGLATATPVTITVPGTTAPIDIGDRLVAGGQQNYLPYLRVTALLNSNAGRTSTPVLSGFETQFTCVSME